MPIPEPWIVTRVPLPGAGKAQHAAHLVDALTIVQKRLGRPFRAHWVPGHQDDVSAISPGPAPIWMVIG
jgi:hypothetical protein